MVRTASFWTYKKFVTGMFGDKFREEIHNGERPENGNKSVHTDKLSRTACSNLLKQVFNEPLTTCNKLDGIVRAVTRLYKQD